MSKSVPATVENLFICAFCGKKVWHVEVSAPPYGIETVSKGVVTSRKESMTFKVDCLDKAELSSALATCPAMIEMGFYYLHLRPDGSGRADYF